MPMWYTKLIYLVLLIIGLFFSVLYEGIFSMLLLGVLILLPLTQLWLTMSEGGFPSRFLWHRQKWDGERHKNYTAPCKTKAIFP